MPLRARFRSEKLPTAETWTRVDLGSMVMKKAFRSNERTTRAPVAESDCARAAIEWHIATIMLPIS